MFVYDPVKHHTIVCKECGQPCVPGQLLSYAYNLYCHVVCPA